MFVLVSLLTQTLLLLSSILNTSSLDYNTLVYKQCESDINLKKSIDSISIHSRSKTLSALFHKLESKSFEFKFFKTLVGNEDSAISGMFQCRKDYQSEICHRCVTDLHELSTSLCGNATSVQLQLRGCYLKYQMEVMDANSFGNSHNYKLLEAPEHGLIHKICDAATAEMFAGFEEMREEALAIAAAGVVDGHGFYADNHDLLHVVAQCDGDVDACDCGECVSAAAVAVAEECRWSIAGQVYLDGCYVGYKFYPHGFPGDLYHGEGKSGNTGKSLAIVVGVAAALVFGGILIMFFKRLGTKGDDY